MRRGAQAAAAVPRGAGQPPRRRPLLFRLHRALWGEGGLLDAPRRRRLAAAALRALPLATLLAGSLLVGTRQLAGPVLGWPQASALAALAAVLLALGWRRAVRAAGGTPAGVREQLELGGLVVVAAAALIQAVGGDGAEPPLQPVLYLVMAFLVGFLARPAGLGLVLLATALEAAGWWTRGAPPAGLPALLLHAGFLALFALLYHSVLAARVAAAARAERAAVERRLEEIEQRAREFRRLAPTAGPAGGPERERRWTEAEVVELEGAVRGSVEVAEAALRCHTVALYLLSDDDRDLLRRECRSASEAVAPALPAGEGALGSVVRRGASIRLAGEIKAATYYLDGTRPGALVAVPLVDRRGSIVRGVLVADRLEARPFDDEDEQVLSRLAMEILRAVASERLMASHRRSREEKEGFYEALEQLNRRTTPREVFDAALQVARQQVGGPVELAALTLVERDGEKVAHRVVRAVAGADGSAASPLEGLALPDGTALVAAAVRVDASLPASDADLSRTPVFDPGVKLKGIEAVKVVPVRATPLRHGEPAVLGTLVLGSSRPGLFDRDLTRRLEILALQAGEAIQRARLFEQAERLATTDGLTGLLNHRTFQARLDEGLVAAQRYGRKLSMLLTDIDHFKSVNDTYGHPVGDKVLKAVAQALAAEARATDVVARYGGEEFAVIMPETDAAGALVIAERIRERVGRLVTATDQGPLQVTISIGVATVPDDAARKAELVERADGALYHAKRHGRNRCVPAGSLRAPPAAAPRPGPARA